MTASSPCIPTWRAGAREGIPALARVTRGIEADAVLFQYVPYLYARWGAPAHLPWLLRRRAVRADAPSSSSATNSSCSRGGSSTGSWASSSGPRWARPAPRRRARRNHRATTRMAGGPRLRRLPSECRAGGLEHPPPRLRSLSRPRPRPAGPSAWSCSDTSTWSDGASTSCAALSSDSGAGGPTSASSSGSSDRCRVTTARPPRFAPARGPGLLDPHLRRASRGGGRLGSSPSSDAAVLFETTGLGGLSSRSTACAAAFAAGLPLVGNGGGDTDAIYRDGQNVLLCPIDADALAARLRALRDDLFPSRARARGGASSTIGS